MVDRKSLEFKATNSPSWAQKIEIAILDGVRYERKNGSEAVYMQKSDGYSCLDCNVGIMAVERIHSIHDGLFPLSGSGKVEREQIPYCPKCEEKPSTHGKFITPRNDPNHREFSLF